MEDQACPKCKTTMYRNPQMRLLVNVCGHNLCESCVELLFAKGEGGMTVALRSMWYSRLFPGSGSCPECGMALRRTNFRFQLFEDAAIDRDVDIRRRVLRDFNQREEDFPTLREYNDYLEMVEDIIFNLSNNVDVQETNAKIAKYREKNKEAIGKNRVRASKEQLELEDLLHEEAQADRQRESELRREAEEERRLKEDSKQKVIDDLMFAPEGEDGGGGGDAAAADIVARHAREAKNKLEEIRNTKFSTGKGDNDKLGEWNMFHFQSLLF